MSEDEDDVQRKEEVSVCTTVEPQLKLVYVRQHFSLSYSVYSVSSCVMIYYWTQVIHPVMTCPFSLLPTM